MFIDHSFGSWYENVGMIKVLIYGAKVKLTNVKNCVEAGRLYTEKR